MDSAKNNIYSRKSIYHDIRLLPHGPITLIPTVVASLGVCLSIADDGCDYARLTGPSVELLTGSNTVPHVDVGLVGYRTPGYYPMEGAWRVHFTDECEVYD